MAERRLEAMAILCILLALCAAAVLAQAASAGALTEPAAPTGVVLSSFTARWQDGAILVGWVTVTEIDNVGFNLYRGESAIGPWTKLNDDLIPTKVPPGSLEGAEYTWQDRAVEVNTSYYYMIETVDIRGRYTRYGPAVAGFYLAHLPVVARGR
jgi:hypothetical protein